MSGQYKIVVFIYLVFYVAFNTVQVISQQVVGRAEETSTYSLSRFCTVNCRPTASNYQLSHLRPCREPNPGLRGARRECYHSPTVAPGNCCKRTLNSSALTLRDAHRDTAQGTTQESYSSTTGRSRGIWSLSGIKFWPVGL